MLGMSFIAGASQVASNNRRSNQRHRGAFSHLGQMSQAGTLSPELRKRVEAIDRQIAAEVNRGQESKLPCPECQRPMMVVHAENIELDHCIHCRGFWFDDGELAQFTGLDQDVPSSHLRSRASRFACPVCNETMQESVFQVPFNLLLDRCPHGHGVYCEAKEFEWAMGLSEDVDS